MYIFYTQYVTEKVDLLIEYKVNEFLSNILCTQDFNVYLLFHLGSRILLVIRVSFSWSQDVITWVKLYYNWIHSQGGPIISRVVQISDTKYARFQAWRDDTATSIWLSAASGMHISRISFLPLSLDRVLAAVARSGTPGISIGRRTDGSTGEEERYTNSPVQNYRWIWRSRWPWRTIGREDLLSFFHEEIRRNQLIEANYEQFVFPTDAFWSLLEVRSVFDRKRLIYLLWQLSSNCRCVQSR